MSTVNEAQVKELAYVEEVRNRPKLRIQAIRYPDYTTIVDLKTKQGEYAVHRLVEAIINVLLTDSEYDQVNITISKEKEN